MGNYHFVWPIPDNVSLEASLCENQKNITFIQASAPVYHHQALRRHLISHFGRISRSSNLALLRELYRQAINDQCFGNVWRSIQERRHGNVTFMAKARSHSGNSEDVSK